MSGHVEVLVVGAGFAGVAAALTLRAGGHDVAVIERADRVGGTWRENTYPGVACDVPAHVYSLSSHPNPHWSREFAPGAEIQAYLENVVAAEGLDRVIRFGSALTSARWDATRRRWQVELSGGGPTTAEILVIAAGRLSEPRIPPLPGLGSFPGAVRHTARWDPSWELCDRHVAVVGTGASGVQLVPALVRRGARVTVFQRTPPWILPRGGRAFSPAERHALASDPAAIGSVRAVLTADDDLRFAARAGEPDALDQAVAQADAHLHGQVDDPALRAALTPTTPFGCARVLLSDDYYPALGSDAVTLEASALAAVDGDALVAASGRIHRGADLLVLATGFHAARPSYADVIHGEGGRSLAAHWSKGMTAAATTAVSGFPNLFVVGGPNAALPHTSSLFVLEAQARFVRRALELRDAHDGVLRVDPAQEAADTAAIDRRAAGRPWTAGCRSWYTDARSGRVTVLWPGTVAEFERMLDGAPARVFGPARTGVGASVRGEW